MAQPFMSVFHGGGCLFSKKCGWRGQAACKGPRRCPFSIMKESVTLEIPKEKGRFGKRH